MRNNFTNSSPCFSGECGLCVNCCGNYQSSPVVTEETDETDKKQRTYDQIKFTKNDLEKITQDYWKGLRTIYQGIGYSSPEEPGGLPRNYNVDNYPHGSDIYRLHRKTHDKVCHMPLCQMMYHDTHEYQRTVFKVLPVYVGTHCTLCAPCVRKFGTEMISLL